MTKNSVGYRDPHTHECLDTMHSLRLTNHVLNVEKLSKLHMNGELHQYLHELSQGGNPSQSGWFKRLKIHDEYGDDL